MPTSGGKHPPIRNVQMPAHRSSDPSSRLLRCRCASWRRGIAAGPGAAIKYLSPFARVVRVEHWVVGERSLKPSDCGHTEF